MSQVLPNLYAIALYSTDRARRPEDGKVGLCEAFRDLQSAQRKLCELPAGPAHFYAIWHVVADELKFVSVGRGRSVPYEARAEALANLTDLTLQDTLRRHLVDWCATFGWTV